MRKGFTLIELLVVIAIIGILASIVLVSFPGATKKAKDSRVVSAISQARTVMTYINANEGDYAELDTACATGSAYFSDMSPLCDEVADNAPTGETLHLVSSSDNDTGCIYAKLNAKASYWYCADSRGRAGFVTLDPSGAGYCVATESTTTCPAFE